MTARLLLLFVMLFGIAITPVVSVAGCAVDAAPVCQSCCSSAPHECCAAPSAPAKPAPIAPAGKVSEDGKQLVSPTLIFLCLSPIPAAERPAVQRQHAARLPALPLLDLNCIRLI